MTAPVLDERKHAAALTAALKAAIGTEHVYEYGSVPGLDRNGGVEPGIYLLLTVERRFMAAAHSPRRHSKSAWRATVRAVGTTVNESRWAALRVSQALDGVRLTVDGEPSTPVQHESSNAPEFDDNRAHSLSLWTYTL